MRLNPRGFVLIELLVALVVTATLGAAVIRLVDRSQRLARGLALGADQRAQLAAAAFAVQGAVEGVSPAEGDLVALSDTSVAYMGTVGIGVACAIGAASVDLAATTLVSGIAITWWNTSPQAGDTLVVLDDGSRPDASDDRWVRAGITAVTGRIGACHPSPWLDPVADAGSVGWRLALATALPATVAAGAVVRVVRPERLALYRSGTEWMLGWAEWNPAAGGWNAIQPVAGPLLPPSASGPSGLTLRWLDSLGASLAAPPAASARAGRLSLIGVTRHAVRVDGSTWGVRRDSVRHRLFLPNGP